jgi:hypothetical protein
MKKTIILLTLILCSSTALWARSIIRVFPKDKASLAAIRSMHDLDDMGRGSGYIDFLTTPVQEARLRGLNCRIEVLVPDAEAARRKMIGQKGGMHSFDEMQAELEMIAAGYPAIARLDTLGYSWQGRPILCLKISDNVNVDEDEPELMYMGNHHAREWITVEVPLRLAVMLADSYGVNPVLTDLVNNREFYIIPSVNPDGFAYDYNTDNYWRKNRRNNGDGSYGVDLNRNYDGAQNGDPDGDWGGAGSSHTTSNETYCGPSAFSEPETQAIRDFFLSRQIGMSMSYHTYSELLMWPWGYTADPAPDVEILSALGIEMAGLISSETGSGTYTPQQAMTLYPTTGSSEEWLYGYSRYQSSLTDLAYITEMGYYDFHDTLTSTVNQICAENLEAAVRMAQMAAAPYSYAVPGAPALTVSDTTPSGVGYSLNWVPASSAASIDLYEAHELQGMSLVTDNAESGLGKWAAAGFSLSSNRSHSTSHSFRADSVDGVNATLVSAYPVAVQAGDSLTFWRWVSTEQDYDYYYADISTDYGSSWTNLETITGTGQAAWTRKAFPLSAYAGQQVLVRFRYTSDEMILQGGVYIDDVRPVTVFAIDSTLADTITGQMFGISGRTSGTYYYKVRAHNTKGWGSWSPIKKVAVTGTGVAGGNGPTPVPERVILGPCTPNPVTGAAAIAYQLPANLPVSLKIYNLAGQMIRTVDQGSRPVGRHSVSWDGRDERGQKVRSGIYFYRLQTPGFSATRKITVIR